MANTSVVWKNQTKLPNRIYNGELCSSSSKGSYSYASVWRSDQRSIVSDAC